MSSHGRRNLFDESGQIIALLSGMWLAAAVVLLLLSRYASRFQLSWDATTYLGMTVFFSAVCFVTYWLDKRAAGRDRRRIPERVLHALELLGGWPGALIASQLFRHKTQKVSFRIVLWVIVFLHLALIAYVLFGMLNTQPATPAE